MILNENLKPLVYPSITRSPEEKLIIALLTDRILDYFKMLTIEGNGGVKSEWQKIQVRNGRKAKVWIFDTAYDKDNECLNFYYICKHLGINPVKARIRLRSLSIEEIKALTSKRLKTKRGSNE